jgi:hypothetical protein
MNEINGWELFFSNETIIKASDLRKNVLSTNMKEVEPYDLTFENHMQPKNNSIMHVCQQVDKCVPYEKFASQI